MGSSIKTIILWVFVILLSVSLFIYFGDTSTSFTTGNQVLGTVNGFPIVNKRVSEFAESYRSLQDVYQARGFDVTEYQQALISEAFRRAVIGQLIKEKAEEAKVTVSDSDVVDSIKQDYFKGEIEEFNSFIQTGDSAIQRDLENLMRGRLTKTYFEDILRGLPYTESQLQERIKVSSRQRSALVAIMSVESQVERAITPEVLQTYYQNNISRYNIGTNTSFEDAIEDVRSDYLLENRENVVANIQNSLSFQFQSFTSNQISEAAFRTLAAENDMLVVETSYFNFFSPTINARGGEGQSLIDDRPTIRKLNFIPLNTISEVISRDQFLAVIYINDEVIDDEVSDFVKRRYIQELQEEVWAQVFTAYYASLYRDAQIEVNQQPQGQ